jgi:hypothetical protein
MMIAYGIARTRAARRYGSSGACDDEDRMPVYLRFLGASAIFSFIAAIVYLRTGEEEIAAMMLGMAAALGSVAAFFGIRRWRRRSSPSE